MYQRFSASSDPSTVWSYVPDNALAVYETTKPIESWQTLRASSLGTILDQIPSVRAFNEQFAYLDSLPPVRAALRKKPLLTALQIVGNNTLDATFFLPLSGPGASQKLRQALNDLAQDADLRSEQRQFDGFTIYELSDAGSRTFSYIVHQGMFAGSFTPFLVEDVVRNLANESRTNSFATRHASLLELPKLADDEGNLYVNARRLSALLSIFARPAADLNLEALDALCRSMLLDVSVREEQLLLNGFSEAAPPAAASDTSVLSSDWYLQTFAAQPAQLMRMGDYIPNRTAWLYYLSFGSAQSWHAALLNYQRNRSTGQDLTNQRAAFRERYPSGLTDWYPWLGQEMALLTLESINADEPDRALLMEVRDTARAQQTLSALSASLSQTDTALYQERFSKYVIGELPYPEVPALLLGTIATGYPQCFYLVADEYLIMANNIRTLKRLILDQESENTWNKSLKQRRFLESTLNESNLSLVVDVARSWDLLVPRLSTEWRQIAETHASEFKRLERVAVQFSENEETFYTSLTINYPEQLEPVATTAYTTVGRVLAERPLRTKPYVVRNHSTQSLEVLVQDQDSVLQLISSDQEILWKDSLRGGIIGEVYQVDFYRNGKLQYLFASDSAIHLLDRNGHRVEGYPLYMPAGVKIKHLSLIDYDNSQRYRWLVSDTNGGLWMYNTDRENLEGWGPNGLGSVPATAPFHIRVRDKDCLIAVGQDGTVYAKNRRGEDYPGFPLQLGKACASPAFIVPGSTFAETILTTVTDGGELITFNLLGQITQRTQLYRPSADTHFRLCEDALGKTFALLRQDQETLGVLNRQGTLLFEKNFFSPGGFAEDMLEGQYYNFGAGNEVYAITDRVQEFTYLFSADGELINDRPLESDHAIGLLYFEDQQRYHLYRNFGREFAILSF